MSSFLDNRRVETRSKSALEYYRQNGYAPSRLNSESPEPLVAQLRVPLFADKEVHVNRHNRTTMLPPQDNSLQVIITGRYQAQREQYIQYFFQGKLTSEWKRYGRRHSSELNEAYPFFGRARFTKEKKQK